MSGARARSRPLLVACLVLVSVLVPAAAVLAQANEEGEGTTEDSGENTTTERGDAGDANATEDGNATGDGVDEQAAPAREGPMTDEDAEEATGSTGTAWVLTLSVIVVSLLVGFAVAAVAGDRRR